MLKVCLKVYDSYNVTCKRKVIKDKGGGGKFCLKEEKGFK